MRTQMLEIGFRKKEKIKRVNARQLISLHEKISISEITNNARNKRLQTNMMASIIYSIVIFKYSYSHHCNTPHPHSPNFIFSSLFDFSSTYNFTQESSHQSIVCFLAATLISAFFSCGSLQSPVPYCKDGSSVKNTTGCSQNLCYKSYNCEKVYHIFLVKCPCLVNWLVHWMLTYSRKNAMLI